MLSVKKFAGLHKYRVENVKIAIQNGIGSVFYFIQSVLSLLTLCWLSKNSVGKLKGRVKREIRNFGHQIE